MTQAVGHSIGELRAAMDGPVLTPDDTGFDEKRQVWNAGIDRRPAAIARCASGADVAAAVGHARRHDLEVSVRGGAHNTAGTAVCDDGLMIDLSPLNSVAVDPAERRARVGGGALLADLDAATLAHGLAVPSGLISHTGVGGLTLGGGMGWLSREFGLSIDNLTAAEVITAEHDRLVAQIRNGAPPLFDLVAPMPYVALQQLLDEANAWGLYGYEKGTYVENLTDEVIEIITEHASLKNSPKSGAMFYRLDGAFSQVGNDETAFSGGRSPRYGTFIIGLAPEAETLATERGWVREFWEALRPHAIGSGNGYVNGTTDFSEDRVRSSYGAAKYEELARIKAHYDPHNVFHMNANIRPAA